MYVPVYAKIPHDQVHVVDMTDHSILIPVV